MLKVENIKVYDLKESVIASGYAMRTSSLTEEDYSSEELFQKGLKRMQKLVHTSASTDIHCHDNALTGIRVSFDLTYPQYISPELQRYHWIDIVTSMSKMHRLLKLNIDDCCNKYVSQEAIDNVNDYIEIYNFIKDHQSEAFEFHFRDGKHTINGHQNCLYTAWMQVLSNVPSGLELTMRISTNYKQLQTIYYQRRNHKLKEDWGAFCQMVESLPYFNEFILGIPSVS